MTVVETALFGIAVVVAVLVIIAAGAVLWAVWRSLTWHLR